jgi:hypothetical protein
MKASSRQIRRQRLDKLARRYPTPKENARRGNDPGRALQVRAGGANLGLSGKGLGLRNRRPCQQS